MYFGLLSTYDQNCNTTSEVWSYLVLTSSGQNYIYLYCNSTSWVIRRALNLNTRSWHVVGSIARSTALTSSSVMGEDSLLSERDDFDIGSKEDCFSSLTTNVLVSYIPRNRAILKQRTWCNLWLYDCNSNFTCVVWRTKKLHTGSIFIFLEVAPLEVFASPPPDFLFWVDLDEDVVLWACADGVGLSGLLSTGSLLGTSCFGASSGDGRSSSCWTKQIQRWILFHKIRFAKVSHLLWKNMWVLRRIVIITSVCFCRQRQTHVPEIEKN